MFQGVNMICKVSIWYVMQNPLSTYIFCIPSIEWMFLNDRKLLLSNTFWMIDIFRKIWLDLSTTWQIVLRVS